jgi:hypothetical protein
MMEMTSSLQGSRDASTRNLPYFSFHKWNHFFNSKRPKTSRACMMSKFRRIYPESLKIFSEYILCPLISVISFWQWFKKLDYSNILFSCVAWTILGILAVTLDSVWYFVRLAGLMACSMDFRAYPVDTQKCQVIIRSCKYLLHNESIYDSCLNSCSYEILSEEVKRKLREIQKLQMIVMIEVYHDGEYFFSSLSSSRTSFYSAFLLFSMSF